MRRGLPPLDDHVLVGNLVAGAIWIVPVFFLAWLPAVLAGTYVVLASLALAAAYGRERLTRRRELVTWGGTLLGAMVTWIGFLGLLALLDGTAGGEPEPAGATVWFLVVACVLGVVCCVVWQLTALAVRQVLRWSEGRPGSLSE